MMNMLLLRRQLLGSSIASRAGIGGTNRWFCVAPSSSTLLSQLLTRSDGTAIQNLYQVIRNECQPIVKDDVYEMAGAEWSHTISWQISPTQSVEVSGKGRNKQDARTAAKRMVIQKLELDPNNPCSPERNPVVAEWAMTSINKQLNGSLLMEDERPSQGFSSNYKVGLSWTVNLDPYYDKLSKIHDKLGHNRSIIAQTEIEGESS